MTTNHDAGYTTSGGREVTTGNFSGGSSAHQGDISGGSGTNSLTGRSDRDTLLSAFLGLVKTKSTVAGVPTSTKNYKERYPQYHSLYEKASAISGVPTEYFDQLAFKESTGKQFASSGVAFGLFEFTKPTAKAVGGLSFKNDIYNLQKQAAGVGKLTAQNRAALKSALGREPTFGELYTAHQQGSAGAKGLLNPANRNKPATNFVSRSAITQNGGRAGMTAGEFADHIKNYFGGKSGLRDRSAAGAGGGATVTPNTQAEYDNSFWGAILGLDRNATDKEINAALYNNRGNNTLIGNAADDTLQPADTVTGGMGTDLLSGGAFGDIMGKIASGDVGGAIGDFAGSIFGGDAGKAAGSIGDFVTNPVGAAADVIGNLFGIGTDGSSDSLGTIIEQYFLRIIVIVLGLIFVAVGLSLFGVSQEPIRVIKKVVS